MLDKNEECEDWNEDINEEHTVTLRAKNTAASYVYKTRSHEQLFKLGFTDNFADSQDPENILDHLISDSTSVKRVPVFMKENKFPNPFMRQKNGGNLDSNFHLQTGKITSVDESNKTTNYQTDHKLLDSSPTVQKNSGRP